MQLYKNNFTNITNSYSYRKFIYSSRHSLTVIEIPLLKLSKTNSFTGTNNTNVKVPNIKQIQCTKLITIMGKSNKLLIGGDDTIYTRHTLNFFLYKQASFDYFKPKYKKPSKTKICPVSRPNPSNV